MVALLIEPFGDLVDGLTDCMADPYGPFAAPLSGTDALRTQITGHFGWPLAADYDAPEGCGQFWYLSKAKAGASPGSTL